MISCLLKPFSPTCRVTPLRKLLIGIMRRPFSLGINSVVGNHCHCLVAAATHMFANSVCAGTTTLTVMNHILLPQKGQIFRCSVTLKEDLMWNIWLKYCFNPSRTEHARNHNQCFTVRIRTNQSLWGTFMVKAEAPGWPCRYQTSKGTVMPDSTTRTDTSTDTTGTISDTSTDGEW